MTAEELGAYLRTHIPLTRALGVEVLELSDAVVRLGAPLVPNVNHRQTAFGGSVACLAILSAWGWLHARLERDAPGSRLVIQRQAIEYLMPIGAPFTASCAAPRPDAWHRFSRTFASRRRARIELAAEVRCGESIAATFTGSYVALAPEGSSCG